MFSFFKKKDFLTRVLERHKKGKPVSDFARSLFENETSETINERFKKVRENLKKWLTWSIKVYKIISIKEVN